MLMLIESPTFSKTEYQDLPNPNQPMRLVIPRPFLWGSQPREHYCHSSRRIVCHELQRSGIQFLKHNPPIVFTQSEGICTRLVIFDGHHRVRNAPRFGISEIPCLVFDTNQLFDYNKNKYPEEFVSDRDTFVKVLEKRITWTLESFRNLPDSKQPSFIIGINTLDGLRQRFPAF